MKTRRHIRTFLFFLVIFSFHLPLHSLPLDNIKEYTLENGLTVFILEDTSTPLIRIEYTARAGFSNQTKETSGFFKLYTRIFKAAAPGLNLETAECNANSSRYVLTTVPSKLKEVISSLAQTAFSLSYSNEILTLQLNQLKQEVKEEASSAGGFINSAIDSRVFSAYPWKHDSGVYPALFTKTTTVQARNILSTISDRWYTPQNSALFISGNINEKTILELVENTFGVYYSSIQTPVSHKSVPVNQQRKFVLHSPDFSADMTQIVMQYTVLNIEETELMANLLNNNYSSFKQKLTDIPSLAIPGNEYIDAAAAHKKESSRLIIQSLLQKPEGKAAEKTTSIEQAELFVQTALEAINNCTQQEFYFAQQNAVYNLSAINSSAVNFMENLSAYWATCPYDSLLEEVFDSPENSHTAANYFSRGQKFSAVSQEELITALSKEEPFVFIIINSNDYKKNKKAYSAAGYEEINSTNAAWYNQKIFADYKDPEAAVTITLSDYTKDFYNENISLIKKSELSNGIKLISKYNENSSDITIMLSITGGKLASADDNGFEEALINLLAGNIQKEIAAKQLEGIILGNPTIDYNCGITTGTVTLECAPYDFAACCKAISDAIIYGEILPSQADRAIANRQYKKRLENGTVSFQMLAAIMKELYPKTDFPKIFEAKNDVLTNTTYQKILESYPKLLDASRYSIILTGLVPENSEELLNSTMGLLVPHSTGAVITATAQSKLKNSSTKKTIKVTHTFLTDIPAEKAGPMPSKLIPTTEFLDPVIYVFKIPEAGTKEHTLTLAVLKQLETLVQEQLDKNDKLKDAKAASGEYYSGTDTITFCIMNVANQKEADTCFANAVKELNNLLNSNQQTNIVQQIKDTWIMAMLQDTLSNTGTAMLLQKGLELLPYENQAEYYLKEYAIVENAVREDFISILNNIPAQAPIRFYAKQ